MEKQLTHTIEAVSTFDLKWVKEKIADLTRKAKRIGGIAPPSFILDNKRSITRYFTIIDGNGTPIGKSYKEEVVDIVLHYNIIKVPGWEFVGKVEHLDAGNVLYNTTDYDISGFAKALPSCAHCGTLHQRKETYLVRRLEDNIIIQVGSTCVKNYTGIDPAKVIAWVHWLGEVRGSDWNTPREARYLNQRVFVACCAAVIRENGYTPRSKSDELHIATADLGISMYAIVTGAVSRPKGMRYEELPNKDDVELADAALEYVRGLEVVRSEFEGNLQTLADNAAGIPVKAAGYMAALVPFYKRHLEWETRKKLKAEQDGDSEWVGEVKKRDDYTLTLLTMIELPGGDYGPTYLHKFKDADGNLFVWFASRHDPISFSESYELHGKEYERVLHRAVKQGETVSVRGTVKAHSEYNGVKQTVLTRCAVKEESK